MSSSSGFGLIATTAGLASPQAIVTAAAAIAPPGNTLAQFSRSLPPAVPRHDIRRGKRGAAPISVLVRDQTVELAPGQEREVSLGRTP
jgi:hypothetical protein